MKNLLILLLILFSSTYHSANASVETEKDVAVKVNKGKNGTTYTAYEKGRQVSVLTISNKGKELEYRVNFSESGKAVMNYLNNGSIVQSVPGLEDDGQWMWVVLICLNGEVSYNSQTGWTVGVTWNCLQIANQIQIGIN